MARAFAEHVAALTDKRLWFDNPLAVRDSRREFRHNRVFYAVLTLCIALLVLDGFGEWSLYRILKYERHVPDWLGGQFGSATVILVSGIHFWWVARAAQRRVDGMLMREATLDGMTSLLMLPMSRLSLTLQAAVYPWMAAATVALLLLPVYVFCVGIDGMTRAELFSLYVLFCLVSVALPAFKRPALSGNIATAMLNQGTDDPNRIPEAGSPFRKRGARVSLGGIVLIGIIPAFLLFLTVAVGFGRGQMFDTLADYVPDSILSLVPSSIISMPFMMARAMITPFAFFQWTMFPLPPVVVLVLAFRYLSLVRTSEFLSVGMYRDLATLPTYRPRRSAEQLFRIALVVVTAGFFWPWAVRDNGLSVLASNPAAKDSGVGGLLFLTLLVAGAWSVIRAGRLGTWMGPFQGSDETRKTVTLGSSLRYCAAPLVICAGVTCLCLGLGGNYSLPPHSLEMAVHIVAIIIAAIVMNIGLRRLTGISGLAACLLTAIPFWGPKAVRPLIYLSPALGIFNQGPRTMYGLSASAGPLYGAGPYWQWVLVDTLAGVIMFSAAWLLGLVFARQRSSTLQDVSPVINVETIYDPTILGSDVFADASQGKLESASLTDSPLSLLIIRAVGRCVDNAVVTRDLRARLRNRITASKIATLFMGVVVVSAVISKWFPFLALPGSGFAESIYGALPHDSVLQTLANLQGCVYIALSITAFLCGYSVLPRAFGIDKRKNTLSFLLTTPMSTWSIVSGKAFVLLLTCGSAFWFSAIVSLVFCIPIVLLSGGLIGFSWWAAIFGSEVLGYAATAMVMLALGSLFPNLTTMRLNGCVRLVVLYFVYTGASLLLSLFGLFGWSFHFTQVSIWVSSVAIAAGIAVLSLMITIGAVTGMRKGDIDLKLAKR